MIFNSGERRAVDAGRSRETIAAGHWTGCGTQKSRGRIFSIRPRPVVDLPAANRLQIGWRIGSAPLATSFLSEASTTGLILAARWELLENVR
jgi:hypothetical protein